MKIIRAFPLEVFTQIVLTTDATPTVIDSIVIPTDYVVDLNITVIGIKDDATLKWDSHCLAGYANDSGTTTLEGTFTNAHKEGPAVWDVTPVLNSPNVDITVTGDGGTNINWKSVTILTKREA